MQAEFELLTLDDAAKLIPGADADTLKRMRRKGVLTCYRPGKAYLTTAADIREAVRRCEVGTKVRQAKPSTSDSSATELANAALDAALAHKPKTGR